MNLLPDFIDPQPEPELVNTLRELGTRALAEHGERLPPIAIEALSDFLTTGRLYIDSAHAESFNYAANPRLLGVPDWVTDMLFAVHQLTITQTEMKTARTCVERSTWHSKARRALEQAQKYLTTTHESVT